MLRDLMACHFGSGHKPTALDVGCGIGAFHPFARGMFSRLCGTDISAASIAQARRSHPDVEYEAYDGNILPYGDGTFDLAVTICVLHHVPPERWLGFLREIRRVVRPGGLALRHRAQPAQSVDAARCHALRVRPRCGAVAGGPNAAAARGCRIAPDRYAIFRAAAVGDAFDAAHRTRLAQPAVWRAIRRLRRCLTLCRGSIDARSPSAARRQFPAKVML